MGYAHRGGGHLAHSVSGVEFHVYYWRLGRIIQHKTIHIEARLAETVLYSELRSVDIVGLDSLLD